jgi:hypothetical protein
VALVKIVSNNNVPNVARRRGTRVKATEAKPLSAEELQTLRQLMERWLLLRYPSCYGGSSEESDAIQTYYSIADDAGELKDQSPLSERDKEIIKKYGEKSIDD